MKIVFYILSLSVAMLFALCSCSSAYQIAGKTELGSLDGETLYLRSLQDYQAVDSAYVEHGMFSMDGVADSVMVVTLFMGDESIMPIVLENGVIQVSISNSQLNASGTPLNDQLYKFISRNNEIERQLNSLYRKEAQLVLDGQNINRVRAEISRETEDLSRQMDEFVLSFIKENYDNVLGPSVFMLMTQTLPYPVLTPQIENILKDAPEVFRNNPMIVDFLSRAEENMKLMEEHQILQINVREKQRISH